MAEVAAADDDWRLTMLWMFLTSALVIALILVCVALVCMKLEDFIDDFGRDDDGD